MKKVLLSAFLAMMLCIPWTQAQQTTPYFEDFESMTADATPTGWSITGSTTSTATSSPSYVWGVYDYSGNKTIRMYNYLVQSGVALINTPSIALPTSGTCQLVFKYTHNATCGNCYVKISTDAGTTFTNLDTLSNNGVGTRNDPGTMTEVTIDLASYLGNTVIIQFWSNANWGSGAIFIDDVEVGPVPTCFQPTDVVASNITSASADFSWTASGHGETQYQYLCIPATDTINWANAQTATTTSATVTGLNPNTNYAFYVRSYCSATDQSKVVRTSFKTPCVAVTTASLPYTEDFESYVGTTYSTAGPTPDCWDVSAVASTKPHVLSTTASTYYAYVNSGTNALTFYGSGNCYAVFPQFESALNTLMVSFYKGMESSSYGILVLGYITAADQDMNSFTPIDTIESTYHTPMGYYERNLNDLPATAYRLALRWYYSSQYSCCVDDITVDVIPTCPKPTDVTVADSTITTTSAAISWTAGSTETAWHLQYKLNADSVWTTVYNVTYPYTINALTPNKKYDVRVQGICTAGVDSSAWSISATFKTACAAVDPASLGVIGFETSEGFTAYSYASSSNALMGNCWTEGNLKSTSYTYRPFVYSSYARTGSNCLKLYAASASSDSAYAVMPEFTYTGSITSYEAHFYMRKTSASSTYSNYNDTLYVGIVSDPEDLSDLEIVGYGVNTTTTYAQQIVTFGSYTGGTTGYIVFLAARDLNATQSSKYASFYIDDLEIVKGRATRTPVVDSVYNITTTTAQVAFSGSNATSYRIVAATEPVSNPDTYTTWAIDTVVTTSPATINVQASTKYYLYVQGYGTDTSFFSNPVTQFRSECAAAAIPFTCGFEASEGFTYSSSWVDGALEGCCWSTLGMRPAGATCPYYRVATDYIHSGSQGLKGFAGSDGYGYWILPEFAVPTDSLVMELWYRTEGTDSYSPYVEIGYMTDPTDSTTFVMLQQLARTTTMTKANQAFQNLSVPSTARIAVRFGGGSSSNYYCGIDDIKIIKCRATATPVIDSVYNITTTTANVAFSGSNATSYRIMAATVAVANPDTFTNWAIDTIVTASPATINVQNSTKYYLYIQGFGTDTSLVSDPTQFVTVCTTITTFPWTEDFDSEASGNFSKACWTNEHISGSGTEIAKITTSPLYYNNTPQLHFDDQYAGTRTHVLTPEFDIPATGTYFFSLDAYRQSRSYYPNEGIRVIVDSGAVKDTTFIPVDIASAGNVGTVSGPGWYTYTFELHNSGIQQIEILDIAVYGYGMTMDNFRVYNPYDSVSVIATAQVSNSGTVEGSGRYLRGAEVTLTATAAEHYHFVQWLQDSVTTATRTITASADTTYMTAVFAPDTFQVTASANPTTMGTVTGAGNYAYGTTATLVAIPNTGHHFVNWSNGLTTDSISFTVTDDTTLTANFAIDTFTITLAVNDTTMGSVTGDGNYAYGATATLVATAKEHYHFVNWNDGNTNATRVITVTDNATYTANFAIDTFTITLAVNDTTMGSVTGDGNYAYGATATLVATPNTGHHFVNWNDGNTNATRVITVTDNATYTANFAIDTFTITLAVNDTTMGSVTGDGNYAYGATATLVATAKEHYHFVDWNDGNTNATRVITVTDNATYTANFAIDSVTITLLVNDTTMGTVEGAGVYAYASTATIKAIAKEGYHFVTWDDTTSLGATDSIRIIEPMSDLVFTAIFAPNAAPEGISEVATGDFIVSSEAMRIIVKAAAGEQIRIYDINGRMLSYTQSAAEVESIAVPATGLYLVKVGDYTARRVIVIR